MPSPAPTENKVPPTEKKRVVYVIEKTDIAPKVLLVEYDFIEFCETEAPWVSVHIKNEKDDRWANPADCIILDSKTRFLLTAILAKQAQTERHHKEIAKLVAQLKKYVMSEAPPFKQ